MCNSKAKLRKIIIFSLVFSITISPLLIFRQSAGVGMGVEAATTIAQDKSKVTNMQKQMTSKKQQIAEIEKEIASLKTNKASLATVKTKLDEKISLIEDTIEIYNEMVLAHEGNIEELKLEIEKTQAEYDSRYKLFLEVLRVAYEEGNASYIEMVVKSENFSDFLTRIDMISDMIEYNKSILSGLKETKNTQMALIAMYEDAQAQTLDYQAKQREKIQEAENDKKEADKVIAQIEKDLQDQIKTQNTIMKDMDDTQSQIQRLLNEISAKQLAEQKPKTTYVGGVLRWPTDTTVGKISSGFVSRTNPVTGRSEFHTGIDIPAPYGSNVYAANDGTVLIATYNSGYGNYVVIEHGGGMTTLYGHNSKLVVSVGQKVKKGDVIAKIGSTGVSTGNHCHFEVSKNGSRENPINYFK